MKPFRRLLAVALCWLLLVLQGQAAITVQLPTGSTLYAHIKTGAATYVHIALTEDGVTGWYHALDATIYNGGAGLATAHSATIYAASGFPFVVTAHATSSASPLAFGELGWDGDSTIPLSGNPTHWLGNAATATATAGVPDVNITHILDSQAGAFATPLDVNVVQVGGSTTPVTNLGIVFNTDFATNYSTTLDMWNVKLGNVAHGGGAATITAGLVGNLSGSVGSALTIATGGITSDAFAAGAITATAIATDAITSAEIATDAIGALEIATAAIGATEAPNLDAAISSIAASAVSVLQSTTITGLASQTVFNLTAGSTDNDAYNGAVAVITDVLTSTQKSFVPILDYVGSTRTVTLLEAPKFTIANTDSIAIVAGRWQVDLVDDALDAGAIAASGAAEIGAQAGVFTDIDDEQIPPARLFKLVASQTDVWLGDIAKTLAIGRTGHFGIDFSIALPPGRNLAIVDTPTIFSGTALGVTFGSVGKEDGVAKILVTGVTAGTYVVEVEVTYDNGATDTARVTIKVVE